MDEFDAEHKARAMEAIWRGTHWLTAAEIARRAPASSAQLERWEQEGAVFSLARDGEHVYPAYAFSPELTPLPVVKAALTALGTSHPLSAAIFFESTVGFLAGQRPREMLIADPERVIACARDLHEDRKFAS